MGLWSVAKSFFTRSSESLGSNYFWGIPQSSSGEVVNSDTAMRVQAVYTCVKILSQTLAMIPLNVYRRIGDDGREIAKDHPLQRLFRLDRPNPLQNHFEFKELLQARLCLQGNAYAYIEMDRSGKIIALKPLCPDHVSVKEVNGQLVYLYTTNRGMVSFGQDEILHIKALSTDGLTGLSPIDQMMELIGSALSIDKHGAASFKNGARLGGVLSHPGKLSPQAIESIRNSWQKQYAGNSNAGKTAILESGMDYKPVAMSNEQAQWIDGMKFKRSEIFGMFQVPPHMGGDLERATFSNIEQQSLDFIQYTMMPWLTRWEAAIQASLFSRQEQEEYFVKFNANAFLRGDGLSRAQKLSIERQNGIISANEWRALEEYNPIEGDGGNKYLIPMNMQDANAEPPHDEPKKDSQPPRTPGAVQQEPASTDSNLNRLKPILWAAIDRITVKEGKASERKSDKLAWAKDFAPEQRQFLRDLLTPVLKTIKEFHPEIDVERALAHYEAGYAERLARDIVQTEPGNIRELSEFQALDKAIRGALYVG